MNFQLAYEQFVLGLKNQNECLENSNAMIKKIQDLAKDLFVQKNMSVVVVGNTKQMSEKKVRQVLEGI